MDYRIIQQNDLLQMCDFIGALRISTFREFPYLYVGFPENEKKYTLGFAKTQGAFACEATDNGQFAGLVTASPLKSEKSIAKDSPAQVFLDHGLNPEEFVYLGEVIVDSRYRQRGLAGELIQRAALEANRKGFPRTCFLCVERPDNHPLKPQGYKSPDSIWKRLGYQKTEMRMPFSWNALDERGLDNIQEHWMVFWISS